MNQAPTRFLALVLLCVSLVLGAGMLRDRTGRGALSTEPSPPVQGMITPLRAPIPPETAVVQALTEAWKGYPKIGRLEGEPDSIRGRAMTYGELQHLRGQAFAPGHPAWSRRDDLVWVVVLRGEIVVDQPQGDTFRQLLVVMDARTGAVEGVGAYNMRHELDTASLPSLARPTGLVPTSLPTRTPGPVLTAAPTKPAAPATPLPVTATNPGVLPTSTSIAGKLIPLPAALSAGINLRLYGIADPPPIT